MGRIYAGILGPLAFLTSLARGALAGGQPESVLWNAWWSLLVFASVGYVIGRLAERTVEESVAGRIAAELEAQRAAEAGGAVAEGAPHG